MKTVRETSGSLKFTLLIAALVLFSRASCFAQGRALDAVLSGEITSSSMGKRPSRTVARRPNSALEIAFRTAETLHSGRLNAKDFADSLSLPPMPALPVAAAAALPVRPPQVGGSVPVGIRFPLPPGITYAPHQRIAVSHPDWGKAQSLRSKIEASGISPEEKAKLLAPWAWLEMREAELMKRLEAIDASWSSIQHRVEAVINRYTEEYWRLYEIDAELTREFAAYEVYCRRQVPPEQVAVAGRECAEIHKGLTARDEVLKDRDLKNVALYKAELPPLVAPHNALINAFNPLEAHWASVLESFIQAATKALASNQSQNAFITYLQKKYGLDDCQREFIHREISKKAMTDEEIEELAAELKATGDYHCPPRQRQ